MSRTLDALVGEHGTALLHYFTRRVLPAEDAADLFQQTLIVVWRKVDRSPADPAEQRAWLYAIAHGELRNHWRAQRRRLDATARLRDHLVSAPPRSLDAGSDVVRSMIRELSPDDQEIVGLTYWEGLTSREVGIVLGISDAAVRKRLERIRRYLRAGLATRRDALAGRAG